MIPGHKQFSQRHAASCRTSLCLGVVCAVLLTVSSAVALEKDNTTSQPARAEKTLPEVTAICRRSVVQLLLGKMQDVMVNGQRSQQFVSSQSGSGSIITKSGYVLTGSHVVAGRGIGAVIFSDQAQTGKAYKFRVVGKNDPMDLAIIKIESNESFTPLFLGSSSVMQKGEKVFVGGFPAGEGFSVKAGVLSESSVGWAYPWGYGGSSHPDYLQAKGIIKSGNSGGPLFNRHGDQVGVCCGSNMAADDGHAIPIDTVIKRFAEIFDTEGANGLELGMTVAGIGPKTGTVLKVDASSPAAAAGVKMGDRITALNGKATEEGLDFYLHLLDRKPGDRLNLTLKRDGKEISPVIALRARPLHAARQIEGLVGGLKVEYYKGQWMQLPDFSKLTPAQVGTGRTIDLKSFTGQDAFALRFTGFIKAPADGAYTFHVASDDGSKLYVGDELVVNNDGLHGTVGAKGYISLKAGLHPITVLYMDYAGGDDLAAYWSGPGFEQTAIPADALFRK
jgi:S1-C subfamily serine protease